MPLPSWLTPAEMAARCRHLPGLVFFDTARDAAQDGAVSYVAAEPASILIGRTDADWAGLRDAVAGRQVCAGSEGPLPGGFAAGWVDYDGAFCFGFYDRLLAYRHAEKTWISVGGADAAWGGLPMRAGDTPEPGERASWSLGAGFQPGMPRADFVRRVKRAQEYIAAGDIYQVNLSHRFSAPWKGGEPFAFYEALRRASPAPHAAFLALHGRSVLSSSPELF